MTGAELKFARQMLGISQQSAAATMGGNANGIPLQQATSRPLNLARMSAPSGMSAVNGRAAIGSCPRPTAARLVSSA
jgi:hypothetical protein